MKPVHSILSNIQALPQFKLLRKHYCYQKFLSLLPLKLQKAVAFVYLREETLFVALSHPGFKMELNYNRDLLKSLLTQIASLDPECKMMQADKVVVFHSKYRSIIKEAAETTTVPYYNELSSAQFDLDDMDAEIQEKFQETKAIIKENIQ